ncbi:MAG: hypothetical protein NC936_05240 [Candidatus Omnitrophica bacterium]|nr:hypothetical protein [Candidatus Omnitrophota bacterium]MCM8771254.1 hypothetical protein [Candidatus Omnitrophota bacterium]
MKKIVCLLSFVLFISGCATINESLSRMSDDELLSYYSDTKSELSYYESQRETNFGSLRGELTTDSDMEKINILTQRLLDIHEEIIRRGLVLP